MGALDSRETVGSIPERKSSFINDSLDDSSLHLFNQLQQSEVANNQLKVADNKKVEKVSRLPQSRIAHARTLDFDNMHGAFVNMTMDANMKPMGCL